MHTMNQGRLAAILGSRLRQSKKKRPSGRWITRRQCRSDRRGKPKMASPLRPATQSSATDGGPAAAFPDAPDLRMFVYGLFFIFGGITSLNDVLIPKLKELFT